MVETQGNNSTIRTMDFEQWNLTICPPPYSYVIIYFIMSNFNQNNKLSYY